MRPGPLYDPLHDEFENGPKDFPGWHEFFDRKIPFRDRLAQFCRSVQYFCAADLAYIDAGVLERPSAEVVIALERAASSLDRDSQLLAAAWLLRGKLGAREARWDVLARLMVELDRIAKERTHG